MWLPCLHLAGVARVTSADMMGGESLSGRVLGHIDVDTLTLYRYAPLSSLALGTEAR
jgi:hypothetical protein